MDPMQYQLEKRKQEFLTQYKALIDEFKLDFMSTPIYLPDGKGGWTLFIKTELMDTTQQPILSPLQI